MPRGYPRYVLAVMVGINFLNYLDRYILPAVATKIQGEFHLTDSQLGLLQSAFLLVYAVATIPFGIWADRGVRKTVVAVGVTIWSLATLFTGLAHNYVQLFAAQAILGVGEASYYPAGTALLGDYFKKEGRGRAMSIWAAGTAVGIAAGYAGGGIIAGTLGWRLAFYMTAVPGLVFAVLAFGVRERRGGAADARGPQVSKPASVTWRTVLELRRIPTVRATIAAETALFFVLGGAAFWLPIYLQRRFALEIGPAGTLAGGVLVVGLLAGSLLGGTIADRLAIRRRVASNLPVGIAGFILGAVFVALALVTPNLVLFVPMFLLGAACLYLYNGPYTAVKQNVVVPTVRATAVTIALLIEHLLGDSYAPWAIGKVSDALHSLQLALLILLAPLLVLAAVFAFLGLAHEDRDGRAMEERWAAASIAP